MRTKISLAIFLALSASLASCATKRYGRMQPLSSLEMAEYDCDDLRIEAAKVEEFLKQVSEGAEINSASVFGFLGDFGIGNAMERNEAEESARERLEQIRAEQARKGCP